jgi:hypothetical protein
MPWLIAMEYLCHKWPRICSTCRKHFPVISSFMTHKTKDRVTRNQLKTGGELMCSGRVSSSCSTGGTRRVNLVTNPVISHEWGNDREVLTTSGTYPWSFVTQIFHSDQPRHESESADFNLTNWKHFFLMIVVLSVLLYTDYDYPFGICKHFLLTLAYKKTIQCAKNQPKQVYVILTFSFISQED